MRATPSMKKTTIDAVVPIRFMGMGVYLAWIYSVQFGGLLFASEGSLPANETWFSLSNMANALCLIFCAVFARKFTPLSKRRGIPWIAAAAMAIGTLATPLAAAGIVPDAILVLGSALAGAGLGLIILLWCEFYATLPTRKVTVYYSASFVLAVALHLGITMLSGPIAVMVTSALPLASAGMFALSRHSTSPALEQEAGPPDSNEGERLRWSFPWRPVLLMAAYSLAFNFSRTTGSDVSETGMIGVALIALVVLIAGLFFFERFDVRHLYRIALPLMVAGMLVQPFLEGPASTLSGILLNASHAGFIILTMIVLSNICYRYGVLALWLFGITRAARVVASVIGGQIGTFALSVHDPAILMLATNLVAIGLVAACMGFLNERELETTWGITPVESKRPIEPSSHPSLTNYYEAFVNRCAQIARTYGLTRREEEVLACLAQGKSVPRIEQELVISNGTAKSHVRHIYAKLDIHSRDELIALVGMDDPASFDGNEAG